jgi:raffinose/stachyose/melibiose transport system substrate-binding protein
MVEGGVGLPTDALGGGDGFAIGKNAPPETIELVKWLTSAENIGPMVESGVAALPVLNGLDSAVQEPVMQTLYGSFSQADYLQLYLDQFLPPAVGLAVNDYSQELFAGTKTAEEVAVAIEETAQQEMD